MTRPFPPSFSVISGVQVKDVVGSHEVEITKVVEAAYRLHGEGRTLNPDSYFLRFPDIPSARIIALPASAAGDVDAHGLKWISSFPSNLAAGLPRASAVLILNDTSTGYPFACLEGSIISAVRTAASAALAAREMSLRRGGRPRSVGFFGTGLIARYVHTYLAANGFTFDEIGVYDRSPAYAQGFREYLEQTEDRITVHDDPENLVRSADLIVFATTAGTPHVADPVWFDHSPVVLHVSLRDLSPEVILAAWNLTDDVEHCMKAGTSLHLTEQRTGNRDFVAGALPTFLSEPIPCPNDRAAIFSPFGLGVLDLAVGRYVHDQVARAGELHVVPGFFEDLKRHG
ncbi:2,3-diaminopropionate biosynthesis protein SbnB [Frankia sp. AgPm24]|uniref:2,3-diaminopropionate biosynthesis protein SbnB n=1 Tax=Frankia sp. AgPm24 TaxID=631128 RepID=UPI00200D531F|nr:2,3-diaminopropionate biosynthesis protein SbnB [Frankia sp. AgPm24]MCK9921113.1 2,3-diaminopropionate biosynthesis protein SbnB [Frankia sp. AgPm24]